MVEKSIRADEGIDAFFLSLLRLQYRAGLCELLRITPTLPHISPGRLCLGPDLVCNSKRCPEVYREVHQQGSGPGKLPWATTKHSGADIKQDGAGAQPAPHQHRAVQTQHKPSFLTLAAREGPSPVPGQCFSLNLEEHNISTQPAKFSLNSPPLPQNVAAGQAHITQAQSQEGLVSLHFFRQTLLKKKNLL